MGYLLAVTVWMNVFLRTAIHGYFGLNAAINKSASVIGAALGAVVTGNILLIVGNATYEEILRTELNPAPGSEAEMSARTAFDTLLSSSPESELAEAVAARPALLEGYLEAYEVAFDTTLWLISGLCILGAIVIAIGLRRSLRAQSTDEVIDEDEMIEQMVQDTVLPVTEP